jgi:4-amino-4-deoxy-L-arabinose transferase-like glycosyltransferase
MPNKKISVSILLFLIIFLGFFLRVYNIDNTPPGIYPDEAVNGQDAIRANNTLNYQWFYPANQGREGFFMNLIALCFKLFGVSILTLKLPAIIFGTLTVLGTYLLAKELFKKESLALIAGFLYATSYWAINFSRISFRANLLPFILVFTFYFMFRALRTRKFSDFAWGGFIFGAGIHTYIAFRVSPLILIMLFFSLLISKKSFLKEYWRHILVFAATMFLAAAPMLHTFFVHPEYFESRSDSISILSPTVNKGHVIETFLESFSLSLIKYNFYGDQNWRHNYPPYPVLDPLVSLAFLFGFLYSLTKFISLIIRRFRKKERDEHLVIYTLLVSWFFVMLIPEFMTGEGLPHALRSIGTLPAVIIISSIVFNYFIEKSQEKSRFYQKIILTMIILMLVSSSVFNFVKYHYFWAKKEKVGLSFNKNLTDMARYINSLPEEKEKFVITSFNTIEKAPVEVLTYPHQVSFLFPSELDRIKPIDSRNMIILFTENNREAQEQLRQKFPNLTLGEARNTLGSIYYVLK